MSYFPSQTDIEMLHQRQKKLFTKIQLLDLNFKILDYMDGALQSGNLSADASSDIRKTFNASFVITDKSFEGAPETKLWMNKYIRVFIGVTEQRTGEIHWYNQGLYVIKANGFQYDENNKTVSIQCVDMAAFYNNTLAGQLTGQKTILMAYDPVTFVPTKTKIRDAIIAVLQLAGIKKYNVEYKNAYLPYNMEYNAGVTYWQILTELRDLYYPYEMFFDDDTFICRKIPSGQNEPVMLDDSVIGDLVMSENTNVNYDTVRNCVEVFGQTVEADYFCSNVQFSDNIYTLDLGDFEVKERKQISFIAPENNLEGCRITAISHIKTKKDVYKGPFYVYTYGSTKEVNVKVPANTFIKGKCYVIEYGMMGNSGSWRFVGQTSIHAMIKLVDEMPTPEQIVQDKITENCYNLQYAVSRDPEDKTPSEDNPNIFKNASPYSIDRIGRRNLVIEDEAIYTDELGMARAEYELWKAARLTDNISMTTILIPWLELNKKIEYKTKYNGAKRGTEYMIQNIQMNLGEYSMTVTMNKYYPFYPEIVKEV